MLRNSAGTWILPMSWIDAPTRMPATWAAGRPMRSAMAPASWETRFWWPSVYGSRTSMARASTATTWFRASVVSSRARSISRWWKCILALRLTASMSRKGSTGLVM